ncbi:MAG: hypothetical protein RIC18_16540 [Hoeflea sp.]|uniref:hypothetical protein n=1 Tax=Hoeflea sp. TaxID=1940281 RepID=UPI0032ED6491
MRVPQKAGTRGSLKWMQRAVNDRPSVLSHPELGTIEWLSPLAGDDFAEYRDQAFLDLLGLSRLASDLDEFWPRRGPQWDALGRSGDTVVLVEAKAHLDEMFSTCQAGEGSRRRIEASFDHVREALGATSALRWTERFYQYANRLAHLWFLRKLGVDARLMLVGFVNDGDVNGPSSPEEWHSAYRMIDNALGLPGHHAVAPQILHVHPDVDNF